jgi:hypothetical protein
MDLHGRFKAKAHAGGESMTGVMRRLIESWIDEDTNAHAVSLQANAIRAWKDAGEAFLRSLHEGAVK